MNARLLIIAIVVVALLSIAVWFTGKTRPQKPTPNTGLKPTRYVEPPPRTISFPPIPQGAVFVYAGPALQAPSELPLYRAVNDFSTAALRTLAENLSTSLEFTSSPSAFVNKGDFTYLRNEQTKSFVLTKTKQTVAVSYQVFRASAQTPPAALDQVAQNFLRSTFSPPNAVVLSVLGSQTGGFDGLIILDRPIPEMTGFTFGFSIGSYPLFTEEYSREWAQVVVDESGAVRSASYAFPPTSLEISNTAQLISISDAIANLNAGRGALLGAIEETGGHGAAPGFIEGKITKATLGYFVSAGLLRPAYLMEGSGTTSAGKQQSFQAVVMASR